MTRDAFLAIPKAINNRGQIVGLTFSVSFEPRPFLLDRDDFSVLEAPFGTANGAVSINNRAEIVGDISSSSGAQRAAMWADGVLAELGILPGAFGSTAADINDRGQIVGISASQEGDRGFIWEDGQLSALPRPTPNVPSNSAALGINDRGQIVGLNSIQGAGRAAILWSDDSAPLESCRTAGSSVVRGCRDSGDAGQRHNDDHSGWRRCIRCGVSGV